jgi:23S rRNA pseudouridine1911/1915/1917 synthase
MPDECPAPADADGGDAFVVPAALAGERLDRALTLLTDWTRAEAQAVVARGEVLVGGRAVGKSHRLQAGDVVEVRGAPEPPEPPVAEPVPVMVRHADDAVIVVSKPAGLVVHPGAGNPHGTLVHGLLARFPELAGVGDPMRPGIVHRLDRDTSGLLVVARTPAAYDALVGALQRREVDREYQTLVAGIPAAPRGAIDAPIGRSQRRRTKMAVRDAGKPARTRYEVEERWTEAAVARLACSLETGRTHQIRVHLSSIGHAVVGDPAYGGRRSVAGIELDRPFLHAARLAFPHPTLGGRTELVEPLPAELAEVLVALGAADPVGPDALGPPAG